MRSGYFLLGPFTLLLKRRQKFLHKRTFSVYILLGRKNVLRMRDLGSFVSNSGTAFDCTA